MDHQNLIYKNFNTKYVIYWHLILEGFSPKLIYMKGEVNIVADALFWLDLDHSSMPTTPTQMVRPTALKNYLKISFQSAIN